MKWSIMVDKSQFTLQKAHLAISMGEDLLAAIFNKNIFSKVKGWHHLFLLSTRLCRGGMLSTLDGCQYFIEFTIDENYRFIVQIIAAILDKKLIFFAGILM